jgi:hypothetical protein
MVRGYGDPRCGACFEVLALCGFAVLESFPGEQGMSRDMVLIIPSGIHCRVLNGLFEFCEVEEDVVVLDTTASVSIFKAFVGSA